MLTWNSPVQQAQEDMRINTLDMKYIISYRGNTKVFAQVGLSYLEINKEASRGILP